MGLIIALVVGAALGWLATLLIPRGEKGRRRNIGYGAFGGLLGGVFLGPLLGGGNLFEAQIYPMTLLDAALGAVILLALLNMFRRRRDHRTHAPDDGAASNDYSSS